MYEVLWRQEAVDQLFELAQRDRRQAQRNLTVVRSFGRDGRGDIKKLEGSSGEWRLRSGNWRMTLAIEGSRVYVAHVDNRRDAF